MTTILNSGYRKILGLFYASRNERIHLREIARKTGLNENSASRFLRQLEDKGILESGKDANLKRYWISQRDTTYFLLSLFDVEKLHSLPLLRQDAISCFLKELGEKPIIAILFGSTARGGFRDGSDIDLLLVVNRKTSTETAEDFAESQTAIKVSPIQIKYPDFMKELRLREDKVIESAITTGYPITNHILFYQLTQNESRPPLKADWGQKASGVKDKRPYRKKKAGKGQA